MKRVLLRLDWVLLVAVSALVILGALLVWSATAQRPDLTVPASTHWLRRHVAAVGIGLVLAIPLSLCSHRRLSGLAPAGHLLALCGLALVPFLGVRTNGARSWIALPFGASVQPGELAKVTVVLGMAAILVRRREAHSPDQPPGPVQLGWALAAGGVPAILVALQPDLGTAMVLVAITLAVFTLSGVRLRWTSAIVLAGVGGMVAAVRFGLLADYQIARLTTFLHPGFDADGVGYNAAQARLAVAAGGATGQGLFQGVRTGGGFVPEQHTDFLFTVAGEELGFAGSAAILVLLSIVLLRGIRIAESAPDLFGRLVAGGVVSWLAVQTFQSVGMTLGLTPVTGIPLPFMSYGGSAMLSCLLGAALLQNIHLHTVTSR